MEVQGEKHDGDNWARSEEEMTEGFIRGIFKVELESLAIQAGYAAELLEEATKDPRHPTRTWLAVQTVLAIAANASKLLWGPRAKKARKQLREEAGVTKDSALKKREIRNSLEHLDQKVIGWAKEGNNRFQHRAVVSADKVPDGDNFGRFDPMTWEVTFLGVDGPISLKAVVAELEIIRDKLSPWT